MVWLDQRWPFRVQSLGSGADLEGYLLSALATVRLAEEGEAAETCSLFWCNSSHLLLLAATESTIGFSFTLIFTSA